MKYTTTVLILVSLLIFIIISDKPGLKLTVSDAAIEYAKEIIVKNIITNIQQLQVPNQQGEVSTIVGEIVWEITNVKLYNISHPKVNFKLVYQQGVNFNV